MSGGRAQAGIEFTICIIFLIMIVTLLTIYTGSRQDEEFGIQAKLESEKLCWQVSNIINTAMYSKGYYTEFSLPATIGGSPYNVSITNGTVSVDYNGHSCIYQITVTNISFRSQPAPFSLCGGDFYVNNTQNGLVINNRSIVGC
ncbi:hypothetical protein H0N99_00735 [Candidatus Micrarchaeota archaeon]|nr:hypothetical protein [Candidatus Micrarchaeota archaeon]